MTTPLWILAATGQPLPDNHFVEIKADVTSSRELGSAPPPIQQWSAPLAVVVYREALADDEGTDDHIEVDRHPIASCYGHTFLIPYSADDASDLYLYMDGESADLGGLAEALAMNPQMLEAMDETPCDRALYIQSVSVETEVRGHRWSRTAMAVLLDAIANSIGVMVFAHSPLDGPEKKIMEGALRSFSMKRLRGNNLYWADTDRFGVQEAVSGYLTEDRLCWH